MKFLDRYGNAGVAIVFLIGVCFFVDSIQETPVQSHTSECKQPIDANKAALVVKYLEAYSIESVLELEESGAHVDRDFSDFWHGLPRKPQEFGWVGLDGGGVHKYVFLEFQLESGEKLLYCCLTGGDQVTAVEESDVGKWRSICDQNGKLGKVPFGQ